MDCSMIRAWGQGMEEGFLLVCAVIVYMISKKYRLLGIVRKEAKLL